MMKRIKTKTLKQNGLPLWTAIIAIVPLFAGFTVLAEAVNLYSYRQLFLIDQVSWLMRGIS
jgi:hypothetical protein